VYFIVNFHICLIAINNNVVGQNQVYNSIYGLKLIKIINKRFIIKYNRENGLQKAFEIMF